MNSQEEQLKALDLAQQREIEHLRKTQCEHCKNKPRFEYDSIYVGDTRLTNPQFYADACAANYDGSDDDVINLNFQSRSRWREEDWPNQWLATLLLKYRRVEIHSQACFATTTFEMEKEVEKYANYHRIQICSHILDDWQSVFAHIYAQINSRELGVK